MNKEKQLIKNTAIVSLGKICTQLITFLLLPLYTYILSTEEYGVVDLLNTLVSLFMPVVTLQIEQGVFRYLLDSRGNKENEKQTRGDEVYDEQEFYDSPGCSRRFRRIKILCL